jgi:hypothetical protein
MLVAPLDLSYRQSAADLLRHNWPDFENVERSACLKLTMTYCQEKFFSRGEVFRTRGCRWIASNPVGQQKSSTTPKFRGNNFWDGLVSTLDI